VLDLVSQGGLSEAQLDDAAAACTAAAFAALPPPPTAAAARDAAEVYANDWRAELVILLRREWRLTRPKLWSNESAFMHLTNAAIVTFMYLRTSYREVDIFPRYTAGWMLCMFWTFFPFIASAETLSDGVRPPSPPASELSSPTSTTLLFPIQPSSPPSSLLACERYAPPPASPLGSAARCSRDCARSSRWARTGCPPASSPSRC